MNLELVNEELEEDKIVIENEIEKLNDDNEVQLDEAQQDEVQKVEEQLDEEQLDEVQMDEVQMDDDD